MKYLFLTILSISLSTIAADREEGTHEEMNPSKKRLERDFDVPAEFYKKQVFIGALADIKKVNRKFIYLVDITSKKHITPKEIKSLGRNLPILEILYINGTHIVPYSTSAFIDALKGFTKLRVLNLGVVKSDVAANFQEAVNVAKMTIGIDRSPEPLPKKGSSRVASSKSASKKKYKNLLS
jgi:hypothetical protein